MSAGIYEMRVEKGSNFSLLVTLQDSAGDPVDLAGSTFRGKIKKTYADPTALAEFTFLITDQNVVENLGKFYVLLTAAASEAIPVPTVKDNSRPDAKYIYDIEKVNGLIVERVLQGQCLVSPEVTF